MTLEERIAKCIGYCRFLLVHGVVWRNEEGSQSVGMVSSEWVDHCLSGHFDGLPDDAYFIEDCECIACASERLRVAAPPVQYCDADPFVVDELHCSQCGHRQSAEEPWARHRAARVAH